MKIKNKSIALVLIGSANALHGIFHLIQFIQSMMLVINSAHHHECHGTWFDEMMHNPIFAIIWAVVGLWTLKIGLNDYKHHQQCRKQKKN